MNAAIIFLLVTIIVLQIVIILKSNKNVELEKPIKSVIDSSEQRLTNLIKDEMTRNREENNKNFYQNRHEISQNIKSMSDSLSQQVINLGNLQSKQLEMVSNTLLDLLKNNSEGLDKIRQSVEDKLTQIQNDNNKKLEEMRATVDEKLHSTLEKRLGQSFQNISERLEALYKQLGEMQSLTSGVNDLKRALTNVKTRGIWGEVYLANIISDILTKEQYDENVATKKGSQDRVEFAVKLPGKDDINRYVYLPIDAKFPQEDYQRLLDAQEEGNKDAVDVARKQLENRIKQEAKNIFEKYIDPPNTTDFAIMFLPTESLFAEVVRNVGLIEMLQREYKVIVTGPTTISALLNSLQMGFRTLAIEKRSSEVWALLGAVKTEFTKFGEILEKTQKKLQEASNTIENAAKKTRTIERKLKTVQELPVEESEKMLIDDER
ncbi:DNA recombination protein RmuC [Thermobrachium celere]|uniref:DNA recombination protein RmuC n=1 Tax=Thermobrachium celere DSM 8682 TaxID=941824 RepID=R7RQ32_9CLOT|nr:DNA recombination protein RmuC [Thermobrachium celere]CDF58322.1 DNA recombination protein RmuC [Thermobrachium celere DSM 8682]